MALRCLTTPKRSLMAIGRFHPLSLGVIVFGSVLVTVCLTGAAAASEAARASSFRFPTKEQQLKGFVDDVDGADVIVKTEFGKLRGKRRRGQPLAGGETWIVDWFLGVPYAKPPTGPLRFKATVPHESWNGTRDALRFSAICPQRVNPTLLLGRHDEDCLYLNIYSPVQVSQTSSMSSGSLYPVMVYIHGGSYRVGTGNVFQGHILAQYGVVVVTINYRLGVFGFLSAREESLEGNYGLYDQIASLEWIHRNILEFRGDPDRVTIFGNSAGGSSVGILSVSPKAKGLFQHVIIQSGSPLSFWAVHNDNADLPSYVRSLAYDVRCNHSCFVDLVACLRKVPSQDLYYSANKMPKITPSGTDLRPVPDGKVVPEIPRKQFAAGLFTGRSLMIGIVDAEMTKHMGILFRQDLENTNIDVDFDDGFERESFERVIRYVLCFKFGYDEAIADFVLHRYTNWTHDDISDPYENRRQYVNFLTDLAMWAPSIELASSVAKSNHPTFVYTMQLDGASADDWTTNHHQLELIYVFGSPFTGVDVDELKLTDSYTDDDRNISRLLMTLWSNFAKTGNPSLSGPGNARSVVNWTEFRRNTGDYLRIISTDSTMQRHHRMDSVAFWNDVVFQVNERLRKPASQSMNPAQQQSDHNWTLVILVLSVIQLAILCIFLILLIFPIKKRCSERRRQ